MKINITPAKSNRYPKKGVLIKGGLPKDWLFALQKLNVNIEHTSVYPVPSAIANELYGCFLVLDELNDTVRELNVGVFQSFQDFIYIPVYSKISPIISKEKLEKVFKVPHIFHLDFGWVTLNEAINWQELLTLEEAELDEVIKPSKTIYSPREIKSFQVVAKEEIDIIKALDLKVAPLKKDKLNTLEKAKLKLFESLFSSKKNTKGGFDIEGKGLLKWLHKGGVSKGSKTSKFKKDFEKLLFRNQKETDKLLSLFKSNPSLALSKAIPLDMLGTSRDAGGGLFKMFGRKSNTTGSSSAPEGTSLLKVLGLFLIVIFIISLFNDLKENDSSSFFLTLIKLFGFILIMIVLGGFSNTRKTSGGGSVNLDSDRMNALRKEYEKMAEVAVSNKEYKKAASIYIKLLKDNYKATTILEDGKFYEEAAVIHLKYNKNKERAANAYENGKFYEKAIELYKELSKKEKVGDIYKLINNKVEADKHYQLVVDDYLNNSQYVKASLIYKYKIEDATKAQEPLLKGWRDKKDAYNCLNNYFANISNEEVLQQHIEGVYKEETDSSNIKEFLKALKIQYEKYEDSQFFTKEIAYKAVAKYIKEAPTIAFSLSSFNTSNGLLKTDTSKFVKNEKKKKRNNS